MVLILLFSFVVVMLAFVVWFCVRNVTNHVENKPEPVELPEPLESVEQSVHRGEFDESAESLQAPGAIESLEQSELPEPFEEEENSDNDIIKQLGELFQTRIIDSKAFLDPNLNMEKAAKLINTNRTYISKVVNIQYGLPYRDLMGKLRLEYSKKLLLEEPNETMVSIAKKCGFLASNQFIRKFREQEGVTPTVWRSSQL